MIVAIQWIISYGIASGVTVIVAYFILIIGGDSFMCLRSIIVTPLMLGIGISMIAIGLHKWLFD